MKNKVYYIFCLLLLTIHNQYASDEENQKNLTEITQKNNTDNKFDDYAKSLIAINIVTPILALLGVCTGKISLFAGICGTHSVQQISCHQFLDACKENDTETDTFVQKNYPHAQVWYDNLAKQYPISNLAQCKLLKSIVSATDAILGDEKLELCCAPHRIYFPEEKLKIVDSLYKKKNEGQDLTIDEQIDLGGAQWALFHEAGHLKNNDLTQGTFVFAGTVAAVEFGYQICKHKIISPVGWPAYLALHAALYAGMMLSQDFLYNHYSRYREARADKFANQLVDDYALLGGKRDLEHHEKIVPDASLKYRVAGVSHPTHASRIQAIDEEIARRNKNLE